MSGKFFIDISTKEKVKDVYNLFDSFKKIGDIYKYYGRSGNSRDIVYVKNIAKEINFDLNIYKERKYPKKYCLHCGNELKYGQKKFCCKSCSVTFNNKMREPISKEIREKISNTLKLKNKNNFIKSYCPICKKQIYGKRRKYCSIKCRQQAYNSSAIFKVCENCGKEFIGQNSRKYCSLKCSNEKIKNNIIDSFLKNEYFNNGNIKIPKVIRDFLFEKNNYKCELCGYEGYNIKTGNSILQLHHIDGNSKNNSYDNLQVICPNCHAKTENYMALNKGRSSRDKRYKRGE